MKKTASLLVVLAAFFTMSSAFSAETPKFGADRHVARGMACDFSQVCERSSQWCHFLKTVDFFLF